jgi:dihydrofolate synthase/folylpolyglutamate synthase
MTEQSLSQWLQRLEGQHGKDMDLGLDRVGAVARRMELLPLPVPVITVAGTNGKGSTVAVLEAVLQASGKTPGVYSSPHFLRFNERIRVAGREMDDAAIVAAFAEIEHARQAISLSYFEFATLAALWLFRRQAVDIVVLEVGLGGRLDAVNIVDADVAVITSIDLDHQHWLGEDRDAIAREKAGVCRVGRPCVVADAQPPQALLDCLSEQRVLLYLIGREFDFEMHRAGWEARLAVPGGKPLASGSLPHSGLLPANVCAALQALLLIGVTPDPQLLPQILRDLPLIGRRQVLQVAGRQYLLDVAHNPAAVDKLHEYLDANPCSGRTIALFAAMSDKDIRGMIRACGDAIDAWFLADLPGNARAASAADIGSMLHAEGQGMISISSNPRQACRRAQSLMGADDRLVVFGSFFTVAEIFSVLDKDSARADS